MLMLTCLQTLSQGLKSLEPSRNRPVIGLDSNFPDQPLHIRNHDSCYIITTSATVTCLFHAHCPYCQPLPPLLPWPPPTPSPWSPSKPLPSSPLLQMPLTSAPSSCSYSVTKHYGASVGPDIILGTWDSSLNKTGKVSTELTFKGTKGRPDKSQT